MTSDYTYFGPPKYNYKPAAGGGDISSIEGLVAQLDQQSIPYQRVGTKIYAYPNGFADEPVVFNVGSGGTVTPQGAAKERSSTNLPAGVTRDSSGQLYYGTEPITTDQLQQLVAQEIALSRTPPSGPAPHYTQWSTQVDPRTGELVLINPETTEIRRTGETFGFPQVDPRLEFEQTQWRDRVNAEMQQRAQVFNEAQAAQNNLFRKAEILESAKMSRAQLQQRAQELQINAAMQQYNQALNAMQQLGGLTAEESRRAQEILQNGTDFVARSFASRGEQSPLARVTQADQLNALYATNNRMREFLRDVPKIDVPAFDIPELPTFDSTAAPAGAAQGSLPPMPTAPQPAPVVAPTAPAAGTTTGDGGGVVAGGGFSPLVEAAPSAPTYQWPDEQLDVQRPTPTQTFQWPSEDEALGASRGLPWDPRLTQGFEHGTRYAQGTQGGFTKLAKFRVGEGGKPETIVNPTGAPIAVVTEAERRRMPGFEDGTGFSSATINPRPTGGFLNSLREALGGLGRFQQSNRERAKGALRGVGVNPEGGFARTVARGFETAPQVVGMADAGGLGAAGGMFRRMARGERAAFAAQKGVKDPQLGPIDELRNALNAARKEATEATQRFTAAPTGSKGDFTKDMLAARKNVEKIHSQLEAETSKIYRTPEQLQQELKNEISQSWADYKDFRKRVVDKIKAAGYDPKSLSDIEKGAPAQDERIHRLLNNDPDFETMSELLSKHEEAVHDFQQTFGKTEGITNIKPGLSTSDSIMQAIYGEEGLPISTGFGTFKDLDDLLAFVEENPQWREAAAPIIEKLRGTPGFEDGTGFLTAFNNAVASGGSYDATAAINAFNAAQGGATAPTGAGGFAPAPSAPAPSAVPKPSPYITPPSPVQTPDWAAMLKQFFPDTAAVSQEQLIADAERILPPAVRDVMAGKVPRPITTPGFRPLTSRQLTSLTGEERDALGNYTGLKYNTPLPSILDVTKRLFGQTGRVGNFQPWQSAVSRGSL